MEKRKLIVRRFWYPRRVSPRNAFGKFRKIMWTFSRGGTVFSGVLMRSAANADPDAVNFSDHVYDCTGESGREKTVRRPTQQL